MLFQISRCLCINHMYGEISLQSNQVTRWTSKTTPEMRRRLWRSSWQLVWLVWNAAELIVTEFWRTMEYHQLESNPNWNIIGISHWNINVQSESHKNHQLEYHWNNLTIVNSYTSSPIIPSDSIDSKHRLVNIPSSQEHVPARKASVSYRHFPKIHPCELEMWETKNEPRVIPAGTFFCFAEWHAMFHPHQLFTPTVSIFNIPVLKSRQWTTCFHWQTTYPTHGDQIEISIFCFHVRY